ncbi:TPA: hypothetical protein RVU02_002354 [Escherichia coli]|nr:hypothetical protein [Escherichia coli]HEA3597663.1 hypothetical protein [Escherichia coli]
MEFKLYDEKPSEKDLFDGQNHSNLADKISSILLQKDINTIGLDGCLGSGKSTVITLIKEKLKDNDKITFIDFDVETYHHGSTKKALINVLYDGIKPKVKNYVRHAFSDHKDTALGNKFSYKKEQKSSMSMWTFSFIFTSILSLQCFRYLLLDFSKLINNESYSTIALIIESVIVVSPLILLSIFQIVRDKNNSINVSDIIKKNSLDTITETVLISKEVGALELKSALNGFLKCVDEHTFILIIDNLDRVSKEKVKEIWSDIELITHNSNSKLKIIIPYSAEHLAKSLSDKDDEGMEFLSKRLPVSFRVPPIISTGWRNAFDYFWAETFNDKYINHSKEISQLIEAWLPKNYLQVTPRLLKRLINDINLSIYTTPKVVSPIAASFYILSCRYNNNPFVWATLNYNIENTKEFLQIHGISEEYYNKYMLSYPQLQRLNGNNKDIWIEDILCLHFQTNEHLAKSELITEPLLTAIEHSNSKDFFKLTDIYGFNSLWKSVLDKTDPIKWILILSEVDDVHLEMTKTIINDVIMALNTKDINIENNNLDISLIQSIEKLRYKQIDYQGSYFNHIRDYLSSSILKLNKIYSDDNANEEIKNNCENIIKIANSFCAIDDKGNLSTILPNQDNISGIFFASALYNHINEYKNLNINEIKLNESELIKSIQHLSRFSVDFDLFNNFFIEKIKLNTEELTEKIKQKTFSAAEEIAMLIEKSNQHYSLEQANLLVLSSIWHEEDCSELCNSSALTNVKEEYPLNFISLALLNSIDTKNNDITEVTSTINVDELLLSSDEFHNIVEQYLLFSFSFDNIVLALNDTEITDYILNPIKALLAKRNIARLNIAEFIKKQYPILCSHYNPDFTLSFFSDWDEPCSEKINSFTKNDIETIDSLFLQDTLDSDKLPLTKKAIINAAKKKTSENKELSTFFIKIDKNLRAIFRYCDTNAISLIKSSNGAIAKWYSDNPINNIPQNNHTRLIFNILSDIDKKATLDSLIDLIYQRDFDVKKQILLIENFGDIIILNDQDKQLVNRTIIRLFPHAPGSASLSGWLDSQKFNFSRWKNDDKELVQQIILSNPDKFPKNSEKLVKSRKKQILE